MMPTSEGRPSGPRFWPSGLHGAGFQSVLAFDPTTQGRMVIGADIAGFHVSSDGGRTWTPGNDGITGTTTLRCAALAFSKVTPGKVYAAVGNGGSGAFLRSLDYGVTWTTRSTTPHFEAGNSNDDPPLPSTHPRSTGNLIAEDSAGGYLYVGTYDQGVMRSVDDGATWTTIALAGGADPYYIRSIALDPADPDILYVGLFNSSSGTGRARAYKLTGISGTPSVSQLTSAPLTVEEITFVSSTLYAACRTSGIYKASSPYTTWSAINTGLDAGDDWCSIVGRVEGADHVLFAGNANPTAHGNGMYRCLKRSGDGGANWTNLTVDSTKIFFSQYDSQGPTWWLSESAPRGSPSQMLGKGSYVAAHLVIDPFEPAHIFSIGRSGAWHSRDDGNTWYPAVRKLNVTIERVALIDPRGHGRFYAGNIDWAFPHSADGGRTWRMNDPTPSSAGDIWSLALHPTMSPSRVYAGQGNRDSNIDGEVQYIDNPETSTTWTSMGLGTATGDKRVFGLGVGDNAGTTVVLAAVETASGIDVWRKSGAGAWASVLVVTGGVQAAKWAPFEWANQLQGTLFFYALKSGVYRSSNYGSTWTRIWAHASDNSSTGYLGSDPNDLDRLYVSANDGLYRIDNATTVGADAASPTTLTGVSRPGALKVRKNGWVYICQRAGAGVTPLLKRSTDYGASWTSISDGMWERQALLPFSLDIAEDGLLVAALNCGGMLIGQDVL